MHVEAFRLKTGKTVGDDLESLAHGIQVIEANKLVGIMDPCLVGFPNSVLWVAMAVNARVASYSSAELR